MKSTSLQVAEVIDCDQTGPHTFPHCWQASDCIKCVKNSRFETILLAAVPSESYKNHELLEMKMFLYSVISSNVVKNIIFCVKMQLFDQNPSVH